MNCTSKKRERDKVFFVIQKHTTHTTHIVLNGDQINMHEFELKFRFWFISTFSFEYYFLDGKIADENTKWVRASSPNSTKHSLRNSYAKLVHNYKYLSRNSFDIFVNFVFLVAKIRELNICILLSFSWFLPENVALFASILYKLTHGDKISFVGFNMINCF